MKSLLRVAIALLFLCFVVLGIRYRPYILQSGSMEPTYRTGSIIIVDTSAPLSSVSIGDVVVYKAPSGERVMHRYIGEDELKGDANNVSQHLLLDENNFIGVPVASFYLPGVATVVISTPLRYLLLISAAVLLVLSFFTSSKSETAASATTSLPSTERSNIERSLK